MDNHVSLVFSAVLFIRGFHSKEYVQDLLLLGEAEEGDSTGQRQADLFWKRHHNNNNNYKDDDYDDDVDDGRETT